MVGIIIIIGGTVGGWSESDASPCDRLVYSIGRSPMSIASLKCSGGLQIHVSAALLLEENRSCEEFHVPKVVHGAHGPHSVVVVVLTDHGWTI